MAFRHSVHTSCRKRRLVNMVTRWCVIGLLAMSIAWGEPQATAPALSPAERAARWQEDIQFFVTRFSASWENVDLKRGISTRGQKDFDKLYPRDSFHAAIDSLKADIPNLTDEEVVLRLMRLVASANVAHNGVRFPPGMGFSAQLPLDFHWYPDGLAVTAATPEYAAALGARVVKFGPMTPEQLLTAVSPYVAHENDVWLRQQALQFIRRGAVLRHFALLGPDGRVLVTLDKPGTPQFTLSVAPVGPEAKLILFTEALHVPTPLFLSHPGKYYWYQKLEDSPTLYVQYNVCENDPQLRFDNFARKALAEADTHAVNRVVVDLRQNGGGDSRVIAPLASGLASRRSSLRHLYVLIGPNTFSSALVNAIDLHDKLKATLVGEPTGGKPSSYGEVKTFVLPNSKLVVQYTTKFFGGKNPAASALQPDMSAPQVTESKMKNSGSGPK